jgi:hypothetical protein
VSRRGWILTLVLAGIALAVLVGVLGTRNEPSTSKADAVSSLCSGLQSLEASVTALTGLQSSDSMTDFQTDVTAVQNDWNQVQGDMQAVQNAPAGSLDVAWSDFESAVRNIPSSDSVSDAVSSVTSSAAALASAAKTAASEVDCSSGSATTATTTSTATTTG